MEEKKFSINGVFQKSKEYIDTRFKLFKLKLVERSSRLIASLIVDVIKIVFALFVVFFLSLALGFYLSELLGSSALGFLATGGIFIVMIALVSVFEVRLERLFMNLSIKRFLQKWNDEIDGDDEEGKQD
ncbi:hypothetical protein GCM10011386_43760 [Parapedobacter defluvii]|uniref:Holin-X, holin superfamily III n=1 Tax=Parapedobacter defluvii TaxID=2045106 RepID=A0ABQ1MTT8_9SPHI|nr:phage holin family protein [Parapedobacter defluvii]RQP15462.1 MAG: hypothetical protein EAS52_15015 [Parapedobacter sp.]GGC46814.1 hypothetical protein GCM10011386_43760 [Parapedobacter defluvii]